MEQERFKTAYDHLKKCYEIRCKLIKNRKNKETERVSTLLVFLHRKIELQIVDLKESEQKGKIKLLNDLGNKLTKHIHQEEDPFGDSFEFLKPPKEDATIGEKVMFDVFNKKYKEKTKQREETGALHANAMKEAAQELVTAK